MDGGGRYDEEIIALRKQLQADGIVLMVINGNKGMGFGVRAEAGALTMMPAFLRMVADDMEKGTSWMENLRIDKEAL